MIFRIADLYMDLQPIFPQTVKFCSAYACPEAPRVDFSVAVSVEDLALERKLAEKDSPGQYFLDTQLEILALYRKICTKLLQYDAFLMHGAAIEYTGKGYLFTAKSGTGKTTHIRLWKQLFGEDKVTIVNGDKPILRVLDGKIYAYGTPWCGKEGYNTNTRVELSGICFVLRATENAIQRIPAEVAIPQLFSQVMISDSADLAKQLELLDTLVETVPLYRLECNMDPQAALVAYEGMKQK